MVELLAKLQNPRSQDVAVGIRFEPDEVVIAQSGQQPMDGALPKAQLGADFRQAGAVRRAPQMLQNGQCLNHGLDGIFVAIGGASDRKSTRLNSSHLVISYA